MSIPAETQMHSQQTPEAPNFLLRRTVALIGATAIAVGSWVGVREISDGEKVSAGQLNGVDTTETSVGISDSGSLKFEENLNEIEVDDNKAEVSPEIQKQLIENTVVINGKDADGKDVYANALVVNVKSQDGKPDQQLMLTSAHLFDFEDDSSKPIRQELGRAGRITADIAPYLDFDFMVDIPGQPSVRVESIAVNTDLNQDTDLAVVRTSRQVAKPGVDLPRDLSKIGADDQASSSEVFIHAIVNGQPISEIGINRMSGVELFSTNQKSDLVAVKDDLCGNGGSGSALAGPNGVELGKVLHAEWDPANPDHARQIAHFTENGMKIPKGYKICQYIDGSSDLQLLIPIAANTAR